MFELNTIRHPCATFASSCMFIGTGLTFFAQATIALSSHDSPASHFAANAYTLGNTLWCIGAAQSAINTVGNYLA